VSLPDTSRAQGAKPTVSVELVGLRVSADEAAAHARAMAMRQAAGQTANGQTCAGASSSEIRVTDCVAATWNYVITDDKIG
jgi:hypothetical protein